uniref:Retrovirus-related Pol polyprotein from type-1 retrotransposable element R1 n=1 Tax=Schizaphis graminum TaxID=13262 RepID=A0A2S2P9L2_SCHGA
MPPVFLLAVGRKRIMVARKEGTVLSKVDIMADTLHRWQTLWESTPKAAWTRTLIPDLSKWWHHGPRQITFHMAQILTGHGCFQQYLWSRNRAHSPACLLCPAEADDAEHTLFICMFWSGERRELEQSLGRTLRPEDVSSILCGPALADLPDDPHTKRRIILAANRRKQLFAQMVKDIMGRKEELERERQHNKINAIL